jgi:hypothetical protein
MSFLCYTEHYRKIIIFNQFIFNRLIVLPLLFKLPAEMSARLTEKKVRNTCTVLPLNIICAGVGGKRRRLSGCYLGGVQSRPQTGNIILVIPLHLNSYISQTGLGIFFECCLYNSTILRQSNNSFSLEYCKIKLWWKKLETKWDQSWMKYKYIMKKERNKTTMECGW